METEVISIHGAREHNLKNISLAIPRNQFVVVTGVSGSGKSTLAFDLLFAEGQRRFLDSMNLYARQFVEQLPRPEVDLITGIPPSVSIEQRQSRGGGKSTVATVTEIYHFLRLLLARLGTQYCPRCQLPVQSQTRDEAGRRLLAETKKRGDLLLLAPVVKNRKGFHTEVAEWASQHGYAEVRADGKIHATAQRLRLDRFREHDVEIVVGVLEKKGPRARPGQKPAHELIDEALRLGRGTIYALGNDRHVTVHSTERTCPQCGDSFGELDPKMFSYNSPRGWCPGCRGFGELFYLPDVERGARAESIEESWFEWQEGKRELCGDCQGARLNPIARAVRLQGFGAKEGRTIVDISNDSVEAALAWINRLRLRGREAEIARDILPEIRERLKFLGEVGLGYLQLGRGATTLSGGESQRIRLAAQLGSNLSGVLYILDEPTIGLHARDNQQLLAALDALKARGNSLVVVEHDEETMRRADYIIDLGPGAGVHGGEVVASGTLKEVMACEHSLTAQCLREHKTYPARGQRRPVAPGGKNPPILSETREQCTDKVMPVGRRSSGASPGKGSAGASPYQNSPRIGKNPALILTGANRHTLKNLAAVFPLQRFICLTGVSGSGKSTLLRECLLPAVQARLARKPGPTTVEGAGTVTGTESLRAVYEVDQSPIGRTLRSVPATYVGFFDEIRQLFAQTPEARLRGYTASRFSFNSAQGRCPECLGAGIIKLEMSFMPPAYLRCETCQGARFNLETLDVTWRGLTIAQVLDLTVAQALEKFAAFPRLARALGALRDTGLEYLKLGQTSPTLSGGEAQRLKLVTHLLTGFRNTDEPGARSCLFLLEEPTIGLHAADVKRLVDVLQRLVDAGHTVVVIEHNLEMIAEADWVIDLGPEGGAQGGRIVCQGTPEAVANCKTSHTGRFLRKLLK
jgi:excinuclease ABC subunit A